MHEKLENTYTTLGQGLKIWQVTLGTQNGKIRAIEKTQ